VLVVSALLTGCASGNHQAAAKHHASIPRGYSVEAVKAAFLTQGVRLYPDHFHGPVPPGLGFAYLVANHPRAVRVDVALGRALKPFRPSYSPATAPGLKFTQDRNVLVWWHAPDGASVRAALHRLQ